MSEKLYGVHVGISGAEGYQTLGVKASSQEEALEKFIQDRDWETT